MEATLSEILEQVGGRLAEALSARLKDHGLPDTVELLRSEGRVTVASRSALVRAAEFGTAEHPPRALLERAVRENEALLVAQMARALGNPTA